MATPPAMVSGAWRSGVSQLSRTNGTGRDSKWIGDGAIAARCPRPSADTAAMHSANGFEPRGISSKFFIERALRSLGATKAFNFFLFAPGILVPSRSRIGFQQIPMGSNDIRSQFPGDF